MDLSDQITRLHPQGRWPEGPEIVAYASFCLTFGPRFLRLSLVKRSKSGPQNLKINHFRVPFLDQILNVSQAINGVSRVQK